MNSDCCRPGELSGASSFASFASDSTSPEAAKGTPSCQRSVLWGFLVGKLHVQPNPQKYPERGGAVLRVAWFSHLRTHRMHFQNKELFLQKTPRRLGEFLVKTGRSSIGKGATEPSFAPPSAAESGASGKRIVKGKNLDDYG